uniref:NET domain-containing protein n=1 Tax=viral metagenome TaxID=1070528 RepID=A0A6C0H7B3_9ZZZZ
METKILYLNNLKEKIEKMPKFHQIKTLEIFVKNGVEINESKETFINLSCINDAILKKVDNYVNYAEKQENELNNIENEKKELERLHFSK